MHLGQKAICFVLFCSHFDEAESQSTVSILPCLLYICGGLEELFHVIRYVFYTLRTIAE